MSVRHKKHFLKFLLLLTISLSLTAWSPITVDHYYDLYQVVKPVPLLTQSETGFSCDDAYTFQEEFAKRFEQAGDELVGYKLGLTGIGMPLPFGAKYPVYGRLFKSMMREDNSHIYLSDFVKAMVEIEIAFIFDDDVAYPVTLKNLQASVDKVAPAVEVPDLLFADMKKLSWLDLIAVNVAARRVIIGKRKDLHEVGDVNTITAVAKHEGQIVDQWKATNVMGNQWTALLFLVEKLNSRGYQVKKGDIVITGAMNTMFSAARGTYEVDYGELGMIKFKVIEKQVSIDIKPGSFPNSINPKSKGKTPVAILTTDSFDATTVDSSTVLFGATGNEAAPVHSALEDVDGDGGTGAKKEDENAIK
jgi:2-keto-4-pentenoate hydratase